MIYNIPHIKTLGNSNLKIQWETVHLTPACNNKAGSLFVYLPLEWLEYIQAMNTPAAFQWMIGDAGTIIWGIKNKKNLADKKNKAKMPVIAIGGNQIVVSTINKNFGQVVGMRSISYSTTPQNSPDCWHRIWCVTKLKHGAVSVPHDTPRGAAYLPILDVGAFKRTKSLAAGVTYIKIA